MSITTISEREQALERGLDDALVAGTLLVLRCQKLEAERDALKALVVKVHQARGRYHSQLAMCALYEACGLPNTKPISGEKS